MILKAKLKCYLGLILIVLSLLALANAVWQVLPMMYVDFPCFENQVRERNVASDTRIVYCISYKPLQTLSGGAIYAEGTSNIDEIKMPE